MPERSSPHDRVEFEAPAYTGTFVLQMVLLAFASLGLHVGLFWFAMEFLLPSQKLAPTLALKANVNIVPGSTTVCEGKVWVSVTSMTAPVYGTANDRPPISHLIALDVVTGKTLETNITLSPSPSGLVTMDDQVWCVAETVVYRIENGEAIPRYPQRRLIQPSKPFVHKGLLAVIDKDQSGSATLLTWNDGEWTDEGPVDVSIPASGRWISPELRVVSNGTKTFVVFSDSMSILYREGFAMHPVDTLSAEPEPASALHPENDLSDRLSSMLSTRPAAGRTHLPGWKELPQLNNWGTKWEVALIRDELWAFFHTGPYNDAKVEQFRLENGNWVNATAKFPPEMRAFGVAGGPTGYLVSNDLSLFRIQPSGLERVTTGRPISERIRSMLNRLKVAGLYLFATGTLVLGAGALMRTHRRREYLYGKRTVVQASILQRSIARGIDFMVTVFPTYFWIWVVFSSNSMEQFPYRTIPFSIENTLVFPLLSIFGWWLGSTLLLCYCEGKWGITPGKWLLGIRTLRTTLRPCGMLRSFTRELLVYIDGLFFLTWLPGVLLIALTPHWLRLGDLTADTVVVTNPKSSPKLAADTDQR